MKKDNKGKGEIRVITAIPNGMALYLEKAFKKVKGQSTVEHCVWPTFDRLINQRVRKKCGLFFLVEDFFYFFLSDTEDLCYLFGWNIFVF